MSTCAAIPIPKYEIGEFIMFDRSKTDYAEDREKGTQLGKISHVEISKGGHKTNDGEADHMPGEWEIRYMVEEHDDMLPERCILGPCVPGKPR